MKSDTWLAFDFETSDPNKYTCKIDRVCVVEFNIKTGEVTGEWDFSIHRKRYCGTGLRGIMASPHPKVAHNAGFDLYLMEHRLGIPVKGEVHDTYLMAKHWKNTIPAADLKTLAWWLFGDTYQPLLRLRKWIHKQGLKGEDPDAPQGFDMTRPPDKLVHDYCVHDCRVTAKIAQLMYPKVKDSYAYMIDTQAVRLVMDLEARGIPIDVELLKRFMKLGNRRIKRNTKQATEVLKKEMGSMLRGRKPTGNALREHLADLGERRMTPTEMVRADDTVLRDWKKDEAVRAVQRIRRDQKTVNTYAENILSVSDNGERFGSFHPGLMQSAAVTLRFKARGMLGNNGVIAKGQVQNIPRGPGIRTAFTVFPGYWFTKLDLASIEARLFSAFMEMLMGESFFADCFRKNDSFSPYVWVLRECAGVKDASKKHELYTPYKHGTLGRLYGSSAKRFSAQLRDDFDIDYSIAECQDIFTAIDKRAPFIRRFQRYVTRLIEMQGSISDPYGMTYHVPMDEVYKGVAYLCQGCAGFVLKDWWARVEGKRQEFDCGDYFFNTVHDELDGAISQDGGKRAARRRVKAYCDTSKEIDLFDMPIIAEPSDLCSDWASAG